MIVLGGDDLQEAMEWNLRSGVGGGLRLGSAGAVGKIGLTRGALASAVDREKAPRTEGVNQRRKRSSAIMPTARMGRAARAGRWASACGRGEANGSRPGQRPSGPLGRPGRK
jgi:hypothetical protein